MSAIARTWATIRQPLTFALSSFASSGVDIGLFWILSQLLAAVPAHVAIATVVARVLSATFNFLVNSRVVFKGDRSEREAAILYVTLAGIVMLLSATLTTLGTLLLPQVPEVVVKVVVDVALFVANYFVQKRAVF